jgi:hypothetical protein
LNARLALLLLAVAAAFAAAFGPGVGLFFTADDFVLLHYARDTSAGAIVRDRLLAGPQQGVASPWWRPGWLLLLNAGYETAGLRPAPYRLLIWTLHAGLAAGVWLAARRWLSLPPALAAAAAALFALAPSGAEALLWIAAGTNVLPAAACLFAAAAAYAAWVEGKGRGALATAWLGFLLSFLFREAGYHMPLVVLAAHATLGRGAWTERLRRGILHALPFGLVVLVHNRFLNPFTVSQFTFAENLHLAARHGAAWLRTLFALPDAGWAVGACLAALAAAAAATSARGRFCLLWAAAAAFPFVARSHETRFVYFVHAPLALALAALAGHRAGPGRARAAAGLLFALAAANVLRVPPHVAEAAARSATAAAVVELVGEEGLAGRATVHVDFLPPELFDGLAELIDLFGGSRPAVVNHWLVERPPFLIHMHPGFADLPDETPMLHWDAAARRFVPTTRAALVRGRPLLPMFAFRHRQRLVADWSQVAFDPDVAHLLAPPPQPLDLEGSGRNAVRSHAGGTLSRLEFAVDAPRDGFFVIAFLADLKTVGGRAFVDGVEVPLLTVDGMFNGVPVRRGSREVVLKTAL